MNKEMNKEMNKATNSANDAATSATSRSAQLFERAKKVMPGGVSRNTVLWSSVPPYVAYGKGCRVTDIDGVTRIDTDLTVIDVTARGFALVELAPGITFDFVQERTGAPIIQSHALEARK